MAKETKHIIELDEKNKKAMRAILDSIPLSDTLQHGPAIAYTRDKLNKKKKNGMCEK